MIFIYRIFLMNVVIVSIAQAAAAKDFLNGAERVCRSPRVESLAILKEVECSKKQKRSVKLPRSYSEEEIRASELRNWARIKRALSLSR